MHALRHIGTFVVATSLVASSVSAQTVHSLRQSGERDMRASISLSIPLGGHRGAVTSKPQVSFNFQPMAHQQETQNLVSINTDMRMNDYNLQPREARIGFTLDQDPQLMMNGKPFDLPEGRANASDLEKVAIGAAVLVGIGVLVAGASLIAIATSDPAE